MFKQQNKKFNLFQRVNNIKNIQHKTLHKYNIEHICGINSTTQIFTTLNKHQYITTKFNKELLEPPDLKHQMKHCI